MSFPAAKVHGQPAPMLPTEALYGAFTSKEAQKGSGHVLPPHGILCVIMSPPRTLPQYRS